MPEQATTRTWWCEGGCETETKALTPATHLLRDGKAHPLTEKGLVPRLLDDEFFCAACIASFPIGALRHD